MCVCNEDSMVAKEGYLRTYHQYHTNGNLKFEYQFNADGVPSGIWKEWNEDGQLIDEIYILQGKKVTKYEYEWLTTVRRLAQNGVLLPTKL